MASDTNPRVVHVEIAMDPRDGSRASSNGSISDPEILGKALEVHDYLTKRALYGEAP